MAPVNDQTDNCDFDREDKMTDIETNRRVGNSRFDTDDDSIKYM